MSRGSEHVDNMLDGFVGAMVGDFKLAVWTVFKVRLVVEAAIRDGSAEPFTRRSLPTPSRGLYGPPCSFLVRKSPLPLAPDSAEAAQAFPRTVYIWSPAMGPSVRPAPCSPIQSF